MLRGIVEETARGTADDVFERAAFPFGALHEVVEVRHIGAVMLAPVIFNRLGAHRGSERIVRKGELGEREFGHFCLLNKGIPGALHHIIRVFPSARITIRHQK